MTARAVLAEIAAPRRADLPPLTLAQARRRAVNDRSAARIVLHRETITPRQYRRLFGTDPEPGNPNVAPRARRERKPA